MKKLITTLTGAVALLLATCQNTQIREGGRVILEPVYYGNITTTVVGDQFVGAGKVVEYIPPVGGLVPANSGK